MVLVGDCRWYLRRMSGPVDAIITDPPYELGFMGKAWDKRGLAFDPPKVSDQPSDSCRLAFAGDRSALPGRRLGRLR